MENDFPEISKNEKFELFEKLKLDDQNLNLDFDQYRSKIYNDLSSLENDIILNLIQHDKEFFTMFKAVDEAENILDNLESSLVGYKQKLFEINTEMKSLQERSTEITIKLKNRKQFEEELFKLLDSIILAPEFLNEITDNEIDDDFIDKIKKLNSKLLIFQSGELPESNAIEEIVPELRKTLAKVCSKIYTFIYNKLQMIKKPNTNIQILQQSVFLKYKSLIGFLKKHSILMFQELIKIYISLMEKIYYTLSSKYISELNKLINDKSNKFSLIVTEDLNKELSFSLDTRRLILKEIESDSIIPYIAEKKKQTFYIEQNFKSLNKFLMDMITSEVVFFVEFFDLSESKTIQSNINELFKKILSLFSDNIVQFLVGNCNDIFAIALMIVINIEQKNLMESRKLNFLDSHFDKININLWTKFETIFNNHIASFSKVNVKNIKLLNTGLHPITVRYVEFLGMIRLVCREGTPPMMLQIRIKNINAEFIKYCSLLTQAKLSGKKEEECIFFINNFYYIITKLMNFDTIISHDDPYSFAKKFNNEVETYILILFNDHFPSMTKLINKCITNNELNATTLREKSSIDQNEVNYNKSVIDTTNKSVFSSVANEFNTTFRNKLGDIKKHIFSVFVNEENAKLIYKKFLEELIMKYSDFTAILRMGNHEDIINSVISAHKLMIEINSLIKNS